MINWIWYNWKDPIHIQMPWLIFNVKIKRLTLGNNSTTKKIILWYLVYSYSYIYTQTYTHSQTDRNKVSLKKRLTYQKMSIVACRAVKELPSVYIYPFLMYTTRIHLQNTQCKYRCKTLTDSVISRTNGLLIPVFGPWRHKERDTILTSLF